MPYSSFQDLVPLLKTIQHCLRGGEKELLMHSINLLPLLFCCLLILCALRCNGKAKLDI
jgi:hypothetical protein